jgi:hypothetical protein
VELLLDVGREAGFLNSRDIAGPGAEPDAVEHVRHHARIRLGGDGRFLGFLGLQQATGKREQPREQRDASDVGRAVYVAHHDQLDLYSVERTQLKSDTFVTSRSRPSRRDPRRHLCHLGRGT